MHADHDLARGWARHAARAATDRLRHLRPIDSRFVAQLEDEAIAITRQCGGDLHEALDGLHVGLTAAVRHGQGEESALGRHRLPAERLTASLAARATLQRLLDRLRESA